ncbi:arylesterase [Sphingomonas sp. ac-8]|uniref:arylesterase n=1 Tax=Sphingomonas sp. ac-8 TaxID=3242977 RepID=UPI003A80896F
MEKGSVGYGVGTLLLQALLLGGCDDRSADGVPPEQATVPVNRAEATPVPSPSVPNGPERLVLAFGDSLYAGYGLARGQSLPDGLQTALRNAGINATVVNAGVSGDTTAAGRQRLAFSLDNLQRTPDLVLLGLGGNDVLRQIPPATTRDNLKAMLEELKRRNIPVVLTGMMAPPNLGGDYAGAFNRIFPELAEEYDAVLYPFVLNGVIGNPALMQADRVHPNAKGVQQMVTRIAPVVTERLQRLD